MKKQKLTKVAIGVPSGDMVHADFAICLGHLMVSAIRNGVNIAVINQRSSLVEVGRCEMVESARQVGADKILFLDSDMTFPDNVLTELLKTKADIVCCDAVQRRPPYQPVVKTIDNKTIDHKSCEKDMVELKGVSPACMLVDLKVFDKIERPYFHVEWNGDNEFLGEDFYFSNKARKAGYKIWCNIPLSQYIGHIGNYTFYVPRTK